MTELSPIRRRELRAAAHHLNPVVSISQKGLTVAVLAEIERCLKSHELIKVRLYDMERDQRTALLEQVCNELGCAAVQQIGKLLVLWRENPEKQSAPSTSPEAGRSRKPVSKKQAAASLERRQRKPAR
jgi:RNA-binding protein